MSRLGSQLTKQERINLRKQETGGRHDRKLTKYSDNFNKMFSFFFNSYRKGLLRFCGSRVDIIYDKNGPEAKNTFRKFDNGDYKLKEISSRHPNVVRAVIIGKKAWGLWINEWSDGISQGLFTPNEILQQFEDEGIVIPKPLLTDFYNKIIKKFEKNKGNCFGSLK